MRSGISSRPVQRPQMFTAVSSLLIVNRCSPTLALKSHYRECTTNKLAHIWRAGRAHFTIGPSQHNYLSVCDGSSNIILTAVCFESKESKEKD